MALIVFSFDIAIVLIRLLVHPKGPKSQTSKKENIPTINLVKWYNKMSSPKDPELSKGYWLLATVTGWYRTKRPVQVRPFSALLCSPTQL
jgi:hypothetical protein